MGMEYSDFVDYEKLDPAKRIFLEKLASTFSNIERLGIKFMPESLGETASVYNFLDADFMIAFITESLGTKILDADRIRGKKEINEKFSGKLLYKGIGQDMIAMVVYDLNSVGALPVGLGDILASGTSDYFDKKNIDRTEEIIEGFRIGADESRACLACGDIPTLQGLVNPESLVVTAAGFGIIRPKDRFSFGGKKIMGGHRIYGFESNGIHSNGLTLARAITEKTEEGYATKLPNGEMIGEALLKPTRIYSGLIEDLFDAKVHIAYISHITGHAFQGKIARARKPFTYVIETLPEPQPEFLFLMDNGPVSKREAYRTWNMRVGLVIFASRDYESTIYRTSRKHGIKCFDLGYVERGPRKVIMPFEECGKQVVYTP